MLLCNPECAISAYETGDLTDGSLSGAALIACILNCLCWPIGSLYAMMMWKPDPKNIKGDGTMRTLNSKCLAVLCLNGHGDSGCCVIAHWQSGDGCTDCCEGDAGMACMLNVVGYFALGGLALGDFWTCCCWNPNPEKFKRTAAMHGGKPGNPQVAVAQPMMVVQQPVAVVQQPVVMMQAR